jgi:hypothetical protein
MKVVRYFHIRHENAAKGGATVRVEGDNEAAAIWTRRCSSLSLSARGRMLSSGVRAA